MATRNGACTRSCASSWRCRSRQGDALLDREAPARFLARLDALPPGTRRARFHLLRLRAKAHAPLLQAASVSVPVYLFTVGCITTLVRLVLNKFAGTVLLVLALVPPGEALGIHPGVVLLVILLTTDVWFLPFQLDSYQAAYFGTGGQGFSHAQGRRFMLAKLVVSVLAIAASLPWWRAIGLIR